MKFYLYPWKLNASDLPKRSAAAEKTFLTQPSSATSERVSSLSDAQQDNAFKEYVEASLMLQANSQFMSFVTISLL